MAVYSFEFVCLSVCPSGCLAIPVETSDGFALFFVCWSAGSGRVCCDGLLVWGGFAVMICWFSERSQSWSSGSRRLYTHGLLVRDDSQSWSALSWRIRSHGLLVWGVFAAMLCWFGEDSPSWFAGSGRVLCHDLCWFGGGGGCSHGLMVRGGLTVMVCGFWRVHCHGWMVRGGFALRRCVLSISCPRRRGIHVRHIVLQTMLCSFMNISNL